MTGPIVGDRVLFHPDLFDSIERLDQPLAATIAYVSPDDGKVNLNVISSTGFGVARVKVRVVREGETPPQDEGYCVWVDSWKRQAAEIVDGCARLSSLAHTD